MMDIPFVANPDDLHCMQACVLMVLKSFFPDKEITLQEIDRIFRHNKAKPWSFPATAVYVLAKFGLKARYFSTLDISQWAKGASFVREFYPENVAEEIIANVDFERDTGFINWIISKDLFEKRKLAFKEVESFCKRGAKVIMVVNSNKLNGKQGFTGHSVLVVDIDPESVVFHDPGLPPVPLRCVKRDEFIKAWNCRGTDNDVVVVYGKDL